MGPTCIFFLVLINQSEQHIYTNHSSHKPQIQKKTTTAEWQLLMTG